LNLKKNEFNDDCHHLLQILTPLTLQRFDKMCFVQDAPYDYGHWMKLLGRVNIESTPWAESSQGSSREVSYTLKGGAWLSKSSDVRIFVVQHYKFDP